MTDTGNGSGGDDATTPEAIEGTWSKKYNGLQSVLGTRTRELAEARELAQQATARAAHAEQQAQTYQQLYEALYSPPPAPEMTPQQPPDDEDEPTSFVHPNNPMRPRPRARPAAPKTSEQLFSELAKLRP